MQNIWLKDADYIDFSLVDTKKMYFQNRLTSDFLDSKNKLCIIAAKGLGKTLLLKLKRYDTFKKHNTPIVIPQGNDFDTLSVPSDLGARKINYLGNTSNCKNLWLFVLTLSAIINETIVSGNSDLRELLEDFRENNINISMLNRLGLKIEEISKKIESKHAVENRLRAKFNPSELLNDLLTCSEKSLNRLVKPSVKLLERYYKGINREIFIFIDRVDQQLVSYSNEAWYAIQHGLIEAIFEIYRNNTHVKICCSIRQEAYSTYRGELWLQIKDIVTVLKYTNIDLQNIFNHMISAYENEHTVIRPNLFNNNKIASFTGHETLFNKYCDQDEDIFSYISRHTLGRPRDLAALGEEIHNKGKELTANTLKTIINDASSQEIELGYKEELKRFLKVLSDEKINELFKLLNENIFSFTDIKNICRILSKKTTCDNHGCQNCEEGNHVFCELYNIGLLGFVEPNADFTENRQKFLKPYEMPSPLQWENQLPIDSNWFMLHPGVQSWIVRVNRYHRPIKGIIVGDSIVWSSRDENLMQLYHIQKHINNNKEIDIELSKQLMFHASRLQEYVYTNSSNIKTLNNIKKDIDNKVTSKGLTDASNFINTLISIVNNLYQVVQ